MFVKDLHIAVRIETSDMEIFLSKVVFNHCYRNEGRGAMVIKGLALPIAAHRAHFLVDLVNPFISTVVASALKVQTQTAVQDVYCTSNCITLCS